MPCTELSLVKISKIYSLFKFSAPNEVKTDEENMDYAYEDPEAFQPQRTRGPRTIHQPRLAAPRVPISRQRSRLYLYIDLSGALNKCHKNKEKITKFEM